jgi:hypothetical protein
MPDDTAKALWLQRVLGVTPGTATNAGTDPKSEPAAQSLSLKRLGMCRLAWRQVCAKIATEVATLQQAVVASCRADAEFDEADVAHAEEIVAEIANWVEELDETMADMIDDIINAEPGAKREAAQRPAVGKARELTDFVNADEDFALIDANEYHSTQLRATTLGALSTISKELLNAS